MYVQTIPFTLVANCAARGFYQINFVVHHSITEKDLSPLQFNNKLFTDQPSPYITSFPVIPTGCCCHIICPIRSWLIASSHLCWWRQCCYYVTWCASTPCHSVCVPRGQPGANGKQQCDFQTAADGTHSERSARDGDMLDDGDRHRLQCFRWLLSDHDGAMD